MGKKIIRVILFPAILCLLLVPASLLVLPKNNTAEAGTLHPDADGILSQRRDSIDVLFLGDSLAYCGFMPLELWDTYGIPGFVCSSLAEKTFETQELLEQALGCQSPKVVVLDVNVLYWTCKKEAAAFYKLGAKVPVFRYHDRWKSLGGGDFFSLPHYTAESPNRGYLMKTGVEYSSRGDYMQAYPGRGRPGRSSLGYLRQIAEICAREQIPLVLCSVPSAANWNGSRHDAIAQIAQELGVPYEDGNLEDIGIDWHTDSPDGGDHMNPRGAAKVTAWIGDYLRRSYGLPDRREDPAYENWNRDAENFRGILQLGQDLRHLVIELVQSQDGLALGEVQVEGDFLGGGQGVDHIGDGPDAVQGVEAVQGLGGIGHADGHLVPLADAHFVQALGGGLDALHKLRIGSLLAHEHIGHMVRMPLGSSLHHFIHGFVGIFQRSRCIPVIFQPGCGGR